MADIRCTITRRPNDGDRCARFCGDEHMKTGVSSSLCPVIFHSERGGFCLWERHPCLSPPGVSFVLSHRRVIRSASVFGPMEGARGDEEWLVVLGMGTTTLFESAQPLVQAVGATTFALVDVTVTDASTLAHGDRLYVGPGTWERVVGIERRLTTEELGPAVRAVLAPTIERLIRRNEERFIEVFNMTMFEDREGHPLDLLAGLSDDCQAAIVAARSQRRFRDFADLTDRVACVEQPWELLVERVLLELRGDADPYRWLTA